MSTPGSPATIPVPADSAGIDPAGSDFDPVAVLTDPSWETLDLIQAAYAIRRRYWGKTVQIHILNNAQNGACPEDCGYCTQAKTSRQDIEKYPLKPDEEILAEARLARDAGAHRYCMVFAGRGPNDQRTDTLARLTRRIKDECPGLEICVSAGLLNEDRARTLKAAGVDRLNHNLNTARDHYPNICTTHTYDDRLTTLRAAQQAGLGLCSGLIVGMGETPEQLVEVALELKRLQADSIPVNFLLPFEGNAINEVSVKEAGTGTGAGPTRTLTPDYCLRVLCMFRFVCPSAEIRVAAGREFHLRGSEVLSLYPANSLFLDGYLNARGAERRRTLEMIRDAGFEIQSDRPLEDLIATEEQAKSLPAECRPASDPQDAAQSAAKPSAVGPIEVTLSGTRPGQKRRAELRPAHKSI